MLCYTLKGYARACAPTTGGISDILIFDPNDVIFTQGAAVDGVLPGYTAVALSDGAAATVDDVIFNIINFNYQEAEWKYKQAAKGSQTTYSHELDFSLGDNSQLLTTFQQALDAAAYCCGLGLIIRLNSGRIFVAGEKFVNATSIPRFQMQQDGTSGGSGKAFADENNGDIVLKGDYSRNLFEYTGTWASLLALNAVG